VPPRQPAAWAKAIARLAESPDRRTEMGRTGRLRVEQAFSSAHHARAMLGVYERAIARVGESARP
jgi:glycosyltransferase involved in cell wall biosynthesis